jgi:hypothetical protein
VRSQEVFPPQLGNGALHQSRLPDAGFADNLNQAVTRPDRVLEPGNGVLLRT